MKNDNLSIWRQGRYVPTYLPLGDRRVYSTKWRDDWRKWERSHGAMDINGSALTLVRPYNGKVQQYQYRDMSIADIDPKHITDRELYSPVDTKYMRSHYINGMALKDLVVLEGSQFIRVIEGAHLRGYGRKKQVHRMNRSGVVPK